MSSHFPSDRLTGETLDDEIVFENDDGPVNIPIRKSSSLTRPPPPKSTSHLSSFTRPHHSFKSSRKPPNSQTSESASQSENDDGDECSVGGFADLDEIRDDESVDLHHREGEIDRESQSPI